MAFFEFNGDRRFAAVAFVFGSEDRDWFGGIWRDAAGGPWHFDYRFRFYRERKAHGSADEKNGYRSTLNKPASEDVVIALLRGFADFLVLSGFNDQVDLVELRSSDGQFLLEALRARPWAHVQKCS